MAANRALSMLARDMVVGGFLAATVGCGGAPVVDEETPLNARGIHFDDRTEAAGVQYQWDFPPGQPNYRRNIGAGAAAEDLDGDGHVDLFVAGSIGNSKLFWNRGDGTFDEGAAAAGVLQEAEWVTGVNSVDYDNDGDQDLFLNGRGPLRLLRNEGGRRFSDVTQSAGLEIPSGGVGMALGDFDGDRHVDVLIGQTVDELAGGRGGAGELPEDGMEFMVPFGPVKVLRGSAAGTFEDVSSRFDLPNGHPLAVGIVDLDGDFDVDPPITQDAQGLVANTMYENQGPDGDGFVRLVDVTKSCGCVAPYAAMGIAVTDLDDNGLPELYISNHVMLTPGREVLLFNQGGMRFVDVTEQLDAAPMDPTDPNLNRSVSWAALAFDVENDSLEDLLVVYGELVLNRSSSAAPTYDPLSMPGQRDALLSRTNDGRFEVQTGTGLEDAGRAQAAVVADFDGDGCEDVYVVNLETASRLYRNRCVRGLRYVELLLEGTRSNRDAIGARIRIETAGRVQWRHVLGCSTGMRSCTPKRAHFGLGAAEQVDQVDIYWPSGHVQRLRGLAVNQLHRIIEPNE